MNSAFILHTSSFQRMPKLRPQVRLLAFASLLNDTASEMIYPLLPVFLTGSGGRAGLNPQVRCRLAFGSAAAPQAAGGRRLRTGCRIAGADRRGRSVAGRPDRASHRQDRQGNPFRAARRHHRRRHASRGSGPGLRFPTRARPYRRGDGASAGPPLPRRHPHPDADLVHDRGRAGGDRGDDAGALPP